MKKDRIAQVGVIVAVFAIVILSWMLGADVLLKWSTNLPAPIPPNETAVILHFMEGYNQSSTPLVSGTYLSYYDQTGKLLGTYQDSEVVHSNFIVRCNGWYAYFFKNHTITADGHSMTTLENQSGIKISNRVFSPSEVGYIEDMDLAYGLFNVGIQPGSDTYIHLLRIVSKEKSYDVLIPFYLEDICYDSVSQKFVGLVDETNFRNASGPEYVQVTFDEQLCRFRYEDQVHLLQTGVDCGACNSLLHYVLVNDNLMYYVGVGEDGVSGDDNNYSLYLNTYDLYHDTLLHQEVLIEHYDAGAAGHGVMTGISNFPVLDKKGTLYVFTSDEQVALLNESGTVIREMPFEFAEAISRWDVTSTEERTDFFGSAVTIGSDREIYVLNMYPENIIKIDRLCNDGTYEPVWQGKKPAWMSEYTTIGSFEIVVG